MSELKKEFVVVSSAGWSDFIETHGPLVRLSNDFAKMIQNGEKVVFYNSQHEIIHELKTCEDVRAWVDAHSDK